MLENLTDSEIEEGIQEVDSMWKDTNIRQALLKIECTALVRDLIAEV